MTDPFLTTDMLQGILKLGPEKRKMAMKKVGQEEWARCAEDIFYWLDPNAHPITYVYTKDPHTMFKCKLCPPGLTHTGKQRKPHMLIVHGIGCNTNKELSQYMDELDPIRPFTLMEYFRPIIETWLTEDFIAVEKSRDMMMTWLAVSMFTWDTLFHKGRQYIFQSETAMKTRELIDRVEVIYHNQPVWLKAAWNPKPYGAEGPSRAGIFKVPGLQSEIIGFPQGADKIRQYHPSGVFSDEAAFNPEAGDTFAAIKPAVQNGGKYLAVSSANPGWFQQLCSDTTEEASE